MEGRAALDIGIGINTGEMIAGNIGSDTIMSYTVIGDNVNLGARLESLNKDYGTRILISEATRRQLKGHYDVRALGEVTVKGKTRAVTILRGPHRREERGIRMNRRSIIAVIVRRWRWLCRRWPPPNSSASSAAR